MDLSSSYSFKWPSNPFHEGEVVAIQKRMGTHAYVMPYASKVILPYMTDQHRDFFSFLVVAARDDRG